MHPVECLHVSSVLLVIFNLSPVLWRVNFCKKQAYLTKEHQHAGLFKECTFIVAKFAKGNQQDKSRIAFPAIINFGRDSNSIIFWPQQEGKEAVTIDEGAVV